MRDWKIFYDDREPFSNEDGSPNDAPIDGILLIVQKGDDLGQWDHILHSSDYYKWDKDRWILSTEGITGRTTSFEVWYNAKTEAIEYAKL